ncbi:MAG: Mur ligase domain-containing protein [Cyclobacteriaceae bacterium]|nr:Mur ligase domain-containing protein [Cyclobacteriaceae bacterium]MDW8330921.1 Mur ligase domain-containing protein [Cyclobacteriaceae bacterium]
MTLPSTIHFTGIGSPVCSSLAIHLHKKGFIVSGSDESFSDFSVTELRAAGMMPDRTGWFSEKIKPTVEAVIISSQVKDDNPEIQQAQALGIPVYFYPELVYQLAQDKQRIVIAGSRGRTNLTALLIHTLRYFNRPVDYLVESPIHWLSGHIALSDAPLMIIEGLELSGPQNKKAGFLHYHHHIGVITSINWEPTGTYASEEEYVAQFDAFADNTPKAGILLYNENNTLASVIGAKHRTDVTSVPFKIHPHNSESGKHFVLTGSERVPVKVFGTQNFESMAAARELLRRIGIPVEKFYEALPHFNI